ncbi:unnamed protein product [Didymodactylos carnosus]|nr:unnamed protein product [Didymodactylos carnosus]
MRVTCGNEEQLFIQTILKPDVEKRVKQGKQLPSVLVLEFDAVSRLMFHRKMPKTISFIENKLKNSIKYTTIEFEKYHSLGRNSNNNLRPLLCASGPLGYGRLNIENKTAHLPCTLDNFIFNVFKSNGYSTSLITNICYDYIGGYFGEADAYNVDYEYAAWSCHPEYDVYGNWNSYDGPYGVNRRCINGKYVHKYQMDIIKDFVYKHVVKQLPYFSFISFIEGHEFGLNVLGLVDNDFVELLEHLTSPSFHQQQPPIIFILADHGLHYGPMWSRTRAGRLESRLPILIIIIPNEYLMSSDKKQMLIQNQFRLVTPRDIYWTLFNIASPKKNNTVNDFRRQSLFDDLSVERNCSTEGIPKWLCACSEDGIKINPALLRKKKQ